ncbi:HTH-type transcriptional regulator DmlR [Achromobacter deleyi]|uniref:HTH-type transcriptional regulator DmlR n=1 Tax=Achromobacter deleyi TaxID=1353891 RepID=A0A6S7C1J1_9BURK|nr:LysR family transcriptional regulator [Achromobacter deleyi]CAB3735962.1 HTH-type transcriptional regulator DmlR [Achromobacter deleyi]CAB3914096.1 HTH-type transcriptional regulator DmlR [Achromobacter deleyi]CAB3919579.1 HTH-type transcriptional regulator DmlR [Achromobacter deleyi]
MALDGRVLANIGVLTAVVESGSFARAAEALGITASGVSRAVGRLEAGVGVRLLDRTTRAVALTDEGRRLYEQINPLVAGIGEAIATAGGASAAVKGRLRVNVDAFFARLILAPHLARFLERHPDLTLDLATREQLGDLVSDGFDIAVRFGEPPSSSLVSRKLLDTRSVTVAAPSYLRKHGVPATPADLARHACIQMRSTMTGQLLEWNYRKKGRTTRVETSGPLHLTDGWTMLGACLGGAGIARFKASGVQDLIRQGKLVELLPDYIGDRYALYALYPSRHLPAAKVRAFIDFVSSILDDPAG